MRSDRASQGMITATDSLLTPWACGVKLHADGGFSGQIAAEKTRKHPQGANHDRSPPQKDSATQQGNHGGDSHQRIRRAKREQNETRHHKSTFQRSKTKQAVTPWPQPIFNSFTMTDLYKKIKQLARRFYPIFYEIHPCLHIQTTHKTCFLNNKPS